MEATTFLKIHGAQVGPVSQDELEQMVREKEIQPNDMIWDNELEKWLPLNESEMLRDKLFQTETSNQTLMAIGGGKGGVGKTALTVSIGIALASFGKKVVLVDADLGGANLHNFLGIKNPEYTFFDFYTMQKSTLNEIVLPTSIDHLFFISGACGTLGIANPKYSQKIRFIRELKNVDADFILLDLGAGSSYNVIDFFLAVDNSVVVSSPEPASIQETFHFIKTALLRKLSQTFKNQPALSSLFTNDDGIFDPSLSFSIKELYQEIEKLDKDSAEICRSILYKFHPKLIINMVMKRNEELEGLSLKTAVAELLSVEMDFWGAIPYDQSVRDAAMLQQPFLLHKPKSRASKQLSQIVSAKIQELPKLRRFIERRAMQRLLARLNIQDSDLISRSIICSVKCHYWGDCEYQNGGYPCQIRQLENYL